MAFATLRRGGIEGEGLRVDRGDGGFFALLGFCCGGECRHLPLAICFRVRSQLLLADAAGLSGRFRILGELQSGICACTAWVCPASPDPATAFWLRNAV